MKQNSRFILITLLLSAILSSSTCEVRALDVSPERADTPSQQYTEITKKILLSGIELERFSLNFRMENAKQPKFRKLRYFLGQEAGSSCGLAFEIVGDDQFGIGRKRPLRMSQPALHGALATATIGSIIAGSSSCLELGSNLAQSIENSRHGYDHRSGNKFVVSKLKQIDELLAQREALVAAHTDMPGYERAVVEGLILHDMRDCFINEYSHFNADTRGYSTFQNLFFLFNASYNAIGAAGAGVAYKAVTKPRLNGPANVLFIISGGMASAAPLLGSVISKVVRQQAYDSITKQLNEKPAFDSHRFAVNCQRLQELPPIGEGTLIPSLPATQRLALYTQSEELFRKQLENETTTMRKLDKVALETSLLGPAIGGQLMTQGILGADGFYNYRLRIRKQISHYYAGAIVGTVGTSMAVVGNLAWLLSSLSYEHRLWKEKRLPDQLIKQRLEHIDDLEKTVNAL